MSSQRRDDEPPPAGDDAAPDRDAVEALVEEFFASRRRGDPSDADDFARRVPGREAEFKRLVSALDVLECAAAAAAPRSLSKESRKRLGRFRLLRLVGRGGMGAVYEAVDEELGRHVALKILPGHATLDERELARFRREAQSAARLNHPHIVPLFAFGEDDGTHWLAMQFIEGESFDRVLQRMAGAAGPRFSAGDVARHGIAIADALVSAHAEGVLHRDVKPSNLLLDRSGTVWVTDFGLAKSEGTASITRTGETVGTPRYMAPEAFSGWADPRTDVWGVGATLYELLAGRPAFDGRDRAQLLKQISDVEPPLLRQLDATIPPDLATIVHKCLQKEPAARYASAQELADDLRRFSDGKPIRARLPSLAYKIGLAARRHPIAVRAGLAVFAGFVVVLAAWAVTLSRETAASIGSRRRAEKNLSTAMSAIDRMLTRVSESSLFLQPGFEAQRALLLNDALALDSELLADEQDDPLLRRETARARKRAANLDRLLGHLEPAAELARVAMDEYSALVAAGAAEETRHELAEAGLELVEIRLDQARPDDAEAAARSTVEAAALHVVRAPDCAGAKTCRFVATLHLAQVLCTTGRAGDALALFEPVFAEFERAHGDAAAEPTCDLRSLSLGGQMMSFAHWSIGQRSIARREARRAYDLTTQIERRPDHAWDDRTDRAVAVHWLAMTLTQDDLEPSARECFQEARNLLEGQLAQRPASPQMRCYLAATLDAHAQSLLRRGDFDGARAHLERALEVVKGADQGDAAAAEAGEWVRCTCDLGCVEFSAGDLDAAVDRFRRAIEAGEARLAAVSRHDLLARHVANAHRNLGLLARQRGDMALLQTEAGRARALLDDLAKQRPDDVDVQLERCSALSLVGEALLRSGHPHEAALELERAGAATDLQLGRCDDDGEARTLRALCWLLLGNARRMDGALDAAADAIAHAEQLARARHDQRPDDVVDGLALATALVDSALLERARARHDVAFGRDLEALRLATAASRRPEEPARAHGLLHIALTGIVADLEPAPLDGVVVAALGGALADVGGVIAEDEAALQLVARATQLGGAAVTDPGRR